MAHGNFREQAVEAAPVLGALAAMALVLVDDDDALARPAEGDGMIDEGILPLARFAVFEYLLWGRLAHVDDGQEFSVPVLDLDGAQGHGADVGRGLKEPLTWGEDVGHNVAVRAVHGWPPSWRGAVGVAGQ